MGIMFVIWQVIAFTLFFLWGYKLAINLHAAVICAHVFHRKAQQRSLPSYMFRIVILTIFTCAYGLVRMLREEKMRFFKPYSKIAVIRQTLNGMRSA